ncbi:LOW QUALITY PROTEIN: endogenous retrovirus group 3 member 1 Env polyprotein-like [Aquila chrysaetos chrysaetos]|uniref:LOW QUALITY PROTEIN: endogenous retrovirus group 3 member 1 Env polyprotein-like n=1 Tax=Aquila chrysaetos chrysaetos TaxID=223781 RepID=UPI001176D2BF|nr:LOW QUALITY PROTEIN: endogenous retrovirus group 3 member 1 Env polyprotein-like [Aquila chrysaetos chrysaetos]
MGACVCWATQNWGYESHCGEIQASITAGPVDKNCTTRSCNPVNITIKNPENWKQKQIVYLGLKIYGTGGDPGIVLNIQIKEKSRESIQHRLLFNSFYHEIETGVKYEIPTVAKNLFVNLAENIAKSLKATNCCVCGGTNQGERWPWEANMESNISNPQVWTTVGKDNRKQQWVLQTSVIGKSCWQNLRDDGRQVGNLEREGGFLWNETRNNWDRWGNPLEINNQFKNWTNGTNIPNGWPTPKGHYWICGRLAYAYLPKNWTGSCVLGTIRPSFFLLPINQGERLGVQIYAGANELGKRRQKRNLQTGNWKDNEWPPERIIAYYDPATWAEDGSWGYRTPIYMLNRIIRLQAVVEIIVNKTGDALGLIAKQNTKMRTALYQNRLALDYLLAQEGGGCGKFNLSNCCLEIDDEGEAVNELVTEMKKMAHVPVQTWNGINLGGLWGDFMNRDWLNKIGIVVLGICGGLLIIPCLIPCFTRLIHSVIQGMQISAVPVDPESGREKANSLMIIKTKEDPRLIPIQQALTRLKMKTRINTIKKEMGDCEIY